MGCFFGSLCNHEYEYGEDLIESLGFKAIKLRERPNICSIYVFDSKNTTEVGKVDLSTDAMIKFASDWFKNPGFKIPGV